MEPQTVFSSVLAFLGIVATGIFAWLKLADQTRFAAFDDRLKECKEQLAEVKVELVEERDKLEECQVHINDCLKEKAVFEAKVAHMEGQREYISKEVSQLRDAVHELSKRSQRRG